jgi:hypothetical protein
VFTDKEITSVLKLDMVKSHFVYFFWGGGGGGGVEIYMIAVRMQFWGMILCL